MFITWIIFLNWGRLLTHAAREETTQIGRFTTVPVETLTADTINQAIPELPEFRIKEDLISLYIERKPMRNQNEISQIYKQWREVMVILLHRRSLTEYPAIAIHSTILH